MDLFTACIQVEADSTLRLMVVLNLELLGGPSEQTHWTRRQSDLSWRILEGGRREGERAPSRQRSRFTLLHVYIRIQRVFVT